jgi:hypothetical protein
MRFNETLAFGHKEGHDTKGKSQIKERDREKRVNYGDHSGYDSGQHGDGKAEYVEQADADKGHIGCEHLALVDPNE